MNQQILNFSTPTKHFQQPSNTDILLSMSFNFKTLRTLIFVLCVLINGLFTQGHAQTTCTATAPTAPSVSVNSLYYVSITWTSVVGATSYRIEIKENTGTTWKTYNTTETRYGFNSLNLGVLHNVRIYSVCNASILSMPSPTVNFTTLSCATTVATAPVVTALTSTSVLIDMAFVAGLVKYRVEYKANTDTRWLSFVKELEDTRISLNGLKAETLYNFRVSIICNGSVGAPSAIINCRTLPCVVTPIEDFSVINITSNSALPSWVTVPGTMCYTIEYKTHTATTWKSIPGDSVCYFTGLMPGTLYNMRVRITVVCSGIESTVVSPIISFTTLRGNPLRVSESKRESNQFLIAPNPNNGSFKLNYVATLGELADIDIVDLTGKVMHSEKMQLLTGENSIDLTTSLKQGMYWMRLKTATSYLTKRIMIVK